MEVTVGDLARRCDVSAPTASRELRRLGRAGLVATRCDGNRTLVSADLSTVVATDLRSLLSKVYGPAERVRSAFGESPFFEPRGSGARTTRASPRRSSNARSSCSSIVRTTRERRRRPRSGERRGLAAARGPRLPLLRLAPGAPRTTPHGRAWRPCSSPTAGGHARRRAPTPRSVRSSRTGSPARRIPGRGSRDLVRGGGPEDPEVWRPGLQDWFAARCRLLGTRIRAAHPSDRAGPSAAARR